MYQRYKYTYYDSIPDELNLVPDKSNDEYLYEDRLKWVRDRFDQDHFNFPDDYDLSTSVESIGIMMAQTEKYGGIVLETNKGILPSHSGLTGLSKNKGK